VEDQVARVLGENLENVQIVIAGNHPKARLLATNLAERRARVALLSNGLTNSPDLLNAFSFSPDVTAVSHLEMSDPEADNLLAQAQMVVIWPGRAPWFGEAEASAVRPGSWVLDAEIGGLLPEGMERFRQRGARLIRQNVWPTLAGVLLAAHEAQQIYKSSMGRSTIAGVPVVAGGAMGELGDVVVDSVSQPSRVIGVADSQGRLTFQYTPQDARHVHLVTEEINSRMTMTHLTTLK
jgi:hypothetical protein